MFNLDDEADPLQILRQGTFSVRQSPKGGQWSVPMLATFADYTTISPGDLVFFFQDRHVFGVGRIVSYERSPGVGAWWIWATAADPEAEPPAHRDGSARVALFFEPLPMIFPRGIDMDELLGDARARMDWALRFFWQTSFIEMDDDETRSLLGAFVRRFQRAGSDFPATRPRPPRGMVPFRLSDYVRLRSDLSLKEEGRLRSENVLHGLLVEQMKLRPEVLRAGPRPASDGSTFFHEVAASPPKPAPYADWFDLLRMRTWSNPGGSFPYGWDVIECKAGMYQEVGPASRIIGQLMKYVDFVAREKAARDYGVITGHCIAFGASDKFVQEYHDLKANGSLRRTYVLDPHEPSPMRVWQDLHLWTYRCNRWGALVLEPLNADARI